MRPWLLLSLLGCGSPTQETSGSNSEEKILNVPTVSSLTWKLSWDLTDVSTSASGAWVTTNDGGYDVEVTEAWVVTYALSLVPCETANGARVLPPWMWWMVARAMAAHLPFTDPSLLELSLPERLDPPDDVAVGPITFPLETYCDVYWLVARGDPETVSDGTSLRVKGAWSRAGQSGVIDVDTDFALALNTALPAVPTGSEHLSITLTRPVGRLFDGIDFMNDNAYAQAWQMVSNLVEETTMEVDATAGP